MTRRIVADHNGDPVTYRDVGPIDPAPHHDRWACDLADCWACAHAHRMDRWHDASDAEKRADAEGAA